MAWYNVWADPNTLKNLIAIHVVKRLPDNSWLKVKCLPRSTKVSTVVYHSLIVFIIHGHFQVIRVRSGNLKNAHLFNNFPEK